MTNSSKTHNARRILRKPVQRRLPVRSPKQVVGSRTRVPAVGKSHGARDSGGRRHPPSRLKQREPELLDLMLAISGAVARTALLACARPLPDSRSDSCIEGAAYLGCRSRESVQSPRCVRPEDERGGRSDSGLGASSSSAHLREYLRPEAMSGHAPRSRRTL